MLKSDEEKINSFAQEVITERRFFLRNTKTPEKSFPGQFHIFSFLPRSNPTWLRANLVELYKTTIPTGNPDVWDRAAHCALEKRENELLRFVVLYYDSGNVVGFCMVILQEDENWVAFANSTRVQPEFQGIGLGSMFLKLVYSEIESVRKAFGYSKTFYETDIISTPIAYHFGVKTMFKSWNGAELYPTKDSEKLEDLPPNVQSLYAKNGIFCQMCDRLQFIRGGDFTVRAPLHDNLLKTLPKDSKLDSQVFRKFCSKSSEHFLLASAAFNTTCKHMTDPHWVRIHAKM